MKTTLRQTYLWFAEFSQRTSWHGENSMMISNLAYLPTCFWVTIWGRCLVSPRRALILALEWKEWSCFMLAFPRERPTQNSRIFCLIFVSLSGISCFDFSSGCQSLLAESIARWIFPLFLLYREGTLSRIKTFAVRAVPLRGLMTVGSMLP